MVALERDLRVGEAKRRQARSDMCLVAQAVPCLLGPSLLGLVAVTSTYVGGG